MARSNLIKESIVDKNTYCVSPFNEVHINSWGKVRFCCQHFGIAENVNNTTLQDAFQAFEYKKARLDVLAGRWAKGCDMCIRDEESQKTSTRIDNYDVFNNLDFPKDNFGKKIQKIGIVFSNSCNLRCTMCDPHKSTGWYKDAKVLEDTLGNDVRRAIQEGTPTGLGWDETSEFGLPLDFVDKNLETILNSAIIDCGGGEPFFMPRFTYLVDKLIENNYKGRLKIITNLTLLQDDMIKKLKKLHNVGIVVSTDGINDLYPYMRPSTPFGKYKGKTIQDKIIKYQDVFNMNISYTPQLMNVYNLKEYIEWLEENIANSERFKNVAPKPSDKGFTYRNTNFSYNNFLNKSVTSPRYLRISVHPDTEYKNELADWLEARDAKSFQSLIYQLRMPQSMDDINDWKFFCKTIDILDKHRKTSILKYIPELEKYWIKI
jgi:MoaA/NifB/PqqE/SkfB family radical SAM enzyme